MGLRSGPARRTVIAAREGDEVKLTTATVMLATLADAAVAQVYVRPHFRSDGTFVEGHYRTLPNGVASDNYSHPGNVNPNDRERARRDAPPDPASREPPRPRSAQPKS
jgi:hypothetical protein